MDPLAFAKSILPWIAREANLPRNSFDQPLPQFHLLSPREIAKIAGSDSASAAFAPYENAIIFSMRPNDDPAYVRSCLVHELVHYLQHMNGESFVGEQELMKRERTAYRIQALYLERVERIPSSRYNLTEETLEKCARMSVEGGVVYANGK